MDAVSVPDKEIELVGDFTDTLVNGVEFIIYGSTGNDGTYTVDSAVFGGANTVITIQEDLPSAVADGNFGWDCS